MDTYTLMSTVYQITSENDSSVKFVSTGDNQSLNFLPPIARC